MNFNSALENFTFTASWREETTKEWGTKVFTQFCDYFETKIITISQNLLLNSGVMFL